MLYAILYQLSTNNFYAYPQPYCQAVHPILKIGFGKSKIENARPAVIPAPLRFGVPCSTFNIPYYHRKERSDNSMSRSHLLFPRKTVTSAQEGIVK